MEVSHNINDLSAHLFWDVDKSALDFEKSKVQIIYKVLEFGLISDWEIIQEIYGLETIKNISLELRTLDVVTLAFLSDLFKIEKKQFRCYKHSQLIQNSWNS
jgi:ribosomal protein S8